LVSLQTDGGSNIFPRHDLKMTVLDLFWVEQENIQVAGMLIVYPSSVNLRKPSLRSRMKAKVDVWNAKNSTVT
jgi:hypothetical protein